jgi:hypothetical protein
MSSYMTIAEADAFHEHCDKEFPQPTPGMMHWNDPRQAWHQEIWSGELLSEARRSLVLDAAEMRRIGGDPRDRTICAQCVRDAIYGRVPPKHIITLNADEVAAWLDLGSDGVPR